MRTFRLIVTILFLCLLLNTFTDIASAQDIGGKTLEYNPSAPGTQKVLTLDDCINIAIAKNQNILLAMEDINAAQARIGQAKSFNLPSLTFNSSFNRNLSPQGPPVTTSIGGNTVSFQSSARYLSTVNDQVTLSKVLIDGGTIRAQIDKAKSSAMASIHNLRIQQNNLTLSVSQGFYRVLLAYRLVTVAELSLSQAQEHLKLAEASFKAGTVARADVVFAEVPVATAKLNVARAIQEKDSSEADLNRLMGIDVNAKLALDKEVVLPDVSYDLSQLQDEALKNRPELAMFQAQIGAFKAALMGAKAGNLPVIATAASYGFTGYDNTLIPGFQGWNFNLNLSFPIYNGRLTEYQIKEADANLQKAQTTLDQARQDVLLQVRQAYLNFITAKENVETTKIQVEKANENLRMSEGQYAAGV
ncbi:MAG: TolC family protein, partial [Firmicutes bacterium]|nr:TolC family protein [Bacillota bacterium]